MNNEVTTHLDQVVEDVRQLFLKAALRIEAIKPGEKIPATQLAEDLGKEYGKTGPQLYPILLLLIKNYPGVVVRKGAHGGICREIPTTPVVETSTADQT